MRSGYLTNTHFMRSFMLRLMRFVGVVRPIPSATIIVGTGYPAFQLGNRIKGDQRFRLVFFINEEPWHHRTMLLDAELRYENELVSLVARHAVDYVLCLNKQESQRYSEKYGEQLTKLNCKIVLCEHGQLPCSMLQANLSCG